MTNHQDTLKHHARKVSMAQGMWALRDKAIREAYASGMTYQAIGEAVGLTRQRVAKICEVQRHPVDASEYAPERCEACAGSFGPCYESQCETRRGEE